MVTRDKNYRMSKLTKTMMAFAKSPEEKNLIKNMMIEADVRGSMVSVRKDKEKKKVVANIEVTE